MSFLDECRHLIGLDSTPSRGTSQVGAFIAERARQIGLLVETDLDTLNGVEQMNVLARPEGSLRRDEVLLQTHLDTVEPGHFSAWTKTQSNPFNASIHDGVLYGLGVADSKLDILCKLEALKSFTGAKFRRPPVLVATYGAQNGMVGAIKLMRKKRVQAVQALVGEPTGLRAANAGHGLAIVEITVPFSEEEIDYRQKHDLAESGSTQSKIFVGKDGHSANPDWKDNAIVKMLDYLQQLPSGIAVMELDGGTSYNIVPGSAVLEIDIVGTIRQPIAGKLIHILSVLKSIDSDLRQFGSSLSGYTPTINIGTIRTQADVVRLSGSCRLPPNVSDQDYRAWIERIQAECEKVNAQFSVTDYKKAFRAESGAEVLNCAQKVLANLNLASEPIEVTAATEANVFSRFGVECLVFGPGIGAGNSHAANELVKIEDLNRAVEFYKAMIKELCL